MVSGGGFFFIYGLIYTREFKIIYSVVPYGKVRFLGGILIKNN